MKRRSRVRNLAEYLIFRLIVCLIDILPLRASVLCANWLGTLFTERLPKKLTRYHTARENLKTAFGDTMSEAEIAKTIRGMWVHLFRLVVEIVQLQRKLKLYNCADILSFRGRDEAVRAMCSGRPTIMMGGHFGNWEMSMIQFGMFGFSMGVVARDLDNPYLNEWFRRWRASTGHRMISKKGGSDDMVQYLERGGILGLLGDQDAGPNGLFVPFFGKPASTFKSIALVAMEYRALICVGYARRLPDDFDRNRWVRYEVGCEEIIDPTEFHGPDAIQEITARYTAAIERIVRRAPEQYFWVHRRWKSVPKVRGRKAKAAA